MPSILTREPVLTVGAIVTAIGAALAATNAFGLTTVTPEQTDALAKALIALWPILLVVRQLVTPTAPGATKLPEGHPVQLPDGTTGSVVKS